MTKIRATVITDASWCPHQKVAGWAAWIAGDCWVSEGFSGPTPTLCKSSVEAEVVAAAIGVCLAFRHFKATVILIQSDCTGVRTALGDHIPPDVAEACTIVFRYVKGHTHSSVNNPRFWANRWCDENAKRHMRTLRK